MALLVKSLSKFFKPWCQVPVPVEEPPPERLPELRLWSLPSSSDTLDLLSDPLTEYLHEILQVQFTTPPEKFDALVDILMRCNVRTVSDLIGSWICLRMDTQQLGWIARASSQGLYPQVQLLFSSFDRTRTNPEVERFCKFVIETRYPRQRARPKDEWTHVFVQHLALHGYKTLEDLKKFLSTGDCAEAVDAVVYSDWFRQCLASRWAFTAGVLWATVDCEGMDIMPGQKKKAGREDKRESWLGKIGGMRWKRDSVQAC